jgi:hypothetical protein
MPKAEAPSKEASAKTNISGAEVPKPTMVNPTIKGEIPKLVAMLAAPSTKRSAPQIRIAKPMRIAIINRAVVMSNGQLFCYKKAGLVSGSL